METSHDEMRDMVRKLVEDPDIAKDLSEKDTVEMRKFINPLGNIVTSKKLYVNLVLINWMEKYLRRLLMTTFVGYIYRVAEEYVPDSEIALETARFERELKTSIDPEACKKTHADRVKLITSTAKGIVLNFLNSNFNFNPDKHVRGSHSENSADPERKSKNAGIMETCRVVQDAVRIDEKLKTKQPETYKYMRDQTMGVYQTAAEAADLVKSIIAVVGCPQTDVEDKKGILIKKYMKLRDMRDDLAKIAKPLAASETLAAWKIDPPADVFHHFDRYLTNHYEQIREVTTSLYNENSDLEYAVIIHGAFKTAEEAREDRIQHEGEFKAEVLTVESSHTTLLGPFKENRQRADFYNKNTEILKKMMDQIEADHKLGKDLMEKKVAREKKKNIEEAGPDAPGLAAYTKSMQIAQGLAGANRVLTKEEIVKMEEAKRRAQAIKEDYEVPDDAIQVDIFMPSPDGDKLNRSMFYTQAEADLHLQQDSEFSGKYQPKRPDGETIHTKKTIISRTGQKNTI